MAKPRIYRKLTEREKAVLAAFAEECGRYWRNALRDCWKRGFTGNRGEYRDILGPLGRSHGEAWLRQYRIEVIV